MTQELAMTMCKSCSERMDVLTQQTSAEELHDMDIMPLLRSCRVCWPIYLKHQGKNLQ